MVSSSRFFGMVGFGYHAQCQKASASACHGRLRHTMVMAVQHDRYEHRAACATAHLAVCCCRAFDQRVEAQWA